MVGVRRALEVKKKNSPKMMFWGFSQKSNSLNPFLLEHESTASILTFCKNHMFGKNLVLE